jgi:D-alanyl-D-alanine carboxypeptidase
MKRTICFLFSICITITLCGCKTPDPIRDIAKYLEELDAKEQFSGVVLIAKDGDPIFVGAYGIANRNYDVPNQLDTKFNLGSMNKMFTAVAILQLIEKGKIAVDDKVIDHIPGYPNQEVAKKLQSISCLPILLALGGMSSHKSIVRHLRIFIESLMITYPYLLISHCDSNRVREVPTAMRDILC